MEDKELKIVAEVMAESLKNNFPVDKNSRNLPSSKTEEKAEFNKEFRDIIFNKEFIEKAAVSQATDPALIPTRYSNWIVESIGNYGVGSKYATIQPNDGYTFQFPRTTSTGAPVATWVNESGSASITKPSTTPVTLTMKKLEARVQITDYMMKTTSYDVLSYVQSEVSRQFAKAEDTQIFTGTGSPFTGIYGDSGIKTYTQSATGTFNPTYADLVSVAGQIDASLRDPNRDSVRWVFDRTHLNKIKAIPSSLNAPVFQFPGAQGVGARIDGYSYSELSDGVLNVASTTAATGVAVNYCLFGDLSQVWIGRNQTLQVFVDPYTNRATGTTDYYFSLWEAIGIMQPGAICVYQSSRG
jgi:HK97 family phage major capsid protein